MITVLRVLFVHCIIFLVLQLALCTILCEKVLWIHERHWIFSQREVSQAEIVSVLAVITPHGNMGKTWSEIHERRWSGSGGWSWHSKGSSAVVSFCASKVCFHPFLPCKALSLLSKRGSTFLHIASNFGLNIIVGFSFFSIFFVLEDDCTLSLKQGINAQLRLIGLFVILVTPPLLPLWRLKSQKTATLKRSQDRVMLHSEWC